MRNAPRGGGASQAIKALSGSVPAPNDITLETRFRAFHEAHPEVYDALARLSREWIRRTGRHRLGIAMVYERARWELALQTGETPSLNNDYRAPYARLLMEQEGDLADLFEIRRSQVDGSPHSVLDRTADYWPGNTPEGGLF